MAAGEAAKPEAPRKKVDKQEPESNGEPSSQQAIEAQASEEAALRAYWNDRKQRRRERD
ncbi:MAG: hypothetical protein WDN48_02295 [Pseudolabrys sp.]